LTPGDICAMAWFRRHSGISLWPKGKRIVDDDAVAGAIVENHLPKVVVRSLDDVRIVSVGVAERGVGRLIQRDSSQLQFVPYFATLFFAKF
jgi:hypothetical protein